jgi:hypothetical protein
MQKVYKTLSQPIAGCHGVCLSSQATREVEIGSMVVPGHPGGQKPKKPKKVCENPSQWKKAGHSGACLSF